MLTSYFQNQMKMLIPFLILYFVGTTISTAQFISSDGEYHVAAGALISGGTYAIVYSKTRNKNKAFWYGLGASALAGIAKEIYDSTKPSDKFDAADVAATTVGGLVGCVTLSLFVGKNKKRREKTVAIVN